MLARRTGRPQRPAAVGRAGPFRFRKEEYPPPLIAPAHDERCEPGMGGGRDLLITLHTDPLDVKVLSFTSEPSACIASGFGFYRCPCMHNLALQAGPSPTRRPITVVPLWVFGTHTEDLKGSHTILGKGEEEERA